MKQEFHSRGQDFIPLLDKSRRGCGVDVIALRFQKFLIEAVAPHGDQELHNGFKGQLFLSGKISFRVFDIRCGCRCHFSYEGCQRFF
ncbi:hypothetical protein D3C87_1618450 [compost metagenome]